MFVVMVDQVRPDGVEIFSLLVIAFEVASVHMQMRLPVFNQSNFLTENVSVSLLLTL